MCDKIQTSNAIATELQLMWPLGSLQTAKLFPGKSRMNIVDCQQFPGSRNRRNGMAMSSWQDLAASSALQFATSFGAKACPQTDLHAQANTVQLRHALERRTQSIWQVVSLQVAILHCRHVCLCLACAKITSSTWHRAQTKCHGLGQELYSRSPKVGNPIASILKSTV